MRHGAVLISITTEREDGNLISVRVTGIRDTATAARNVPARR
jgi:hypothetical protein